MIHFNHRDNIIRKNSTLEQVAVHFGYQLDYDRWITAVMERAEILGLRAMEIKKNEVTQYLNRTRQLLGLPDAIRQITDSVAPAFAFAFAFAFGPKNFLCNKYHGNFAYLNRWGLLTLFGNSQCARAEQILGPILWTVSLPHRFKVRDRCQKISGSMSDGWGPQYGVC